MPFFVVAAGKGQAHAQSVPHLFIVPEFADLVVCIGNKLGNEDSFLPHFHARTVGPRPLGQVGALLQPLRVEAVNVLLDSTTKPIVSKLDHVGCVLG